jgi:hypothetical protein
MPPIARSGPIALVGESVAFKSRLSQGGAEAIVTVFGHQAAVGGDPGKLRMTALDEVLRGESAGQHIVLHDLAHPRGGLIGEDQT